MEMISFSRPSNETDRVTETPMNGAGFMDQTDNRFYREKPSRERVENDATALSKEVMERVIFRTIDPTISLDGRPVPAMTTLLYRVCDDDPDKLEEATRLIELFIRDAFIAAALK
jgi:hypothetical protein